MDPSLDEELAAIARALLREAIERSGWYPALSGEERRKRIEKDVDMHWHLMLDEARKRRETVELHVDEIEAGEALEAVVQVKRRRGYRDL
jgi:hypothetical protein